MCIYCLVRCSGSDEKHIRTGAFFVIYLVWVSLPSIYYNIKTDLINRFCYICQTSLLNVAILPASLEILEKTALDDCFALIYRTNHDL